MPRSVLHVVLGLLLCSAAWAGDRPIVVSPGDGSRVAIIEGRCPTFSWGAVAGAGSYELVVYLLGEQNEEAQPVLQETFAGSAFSWTPSLERCLERGGKYAWSVRVVGEKTVSEWSAPSLFEVAPGPGEAEFEVALEVVKEYLAGFGDGDAGQVSARRAMIAPFGEGPTIANAQRETLKAKDPGPAVFDEPGLPDFLALRADINATAPPTPTFKSYAAILGVAEGRLDDYAIGVRGHASGNTAVGVFGTGGFGVRGVSVGGIGYDTPAGVRGEAGDLDSFGGYFKNEEGGTALKALGFIDDDGSFVENYVGLVENDAFMASGPDVLALKVSNADPGGTTNFIGFFDAGSLIGEIEGDAAGGIHFKGGLLTLKSTDSPPTCTAGRKGMIYFDESQSEICFCTGSAWESVHNTPC